MTINARLRLLQKSTISGNSSTTYDGEPGETSPKRLARIAGLLYLLVAISAAFAHSVSTGMYVAGDAATAAANVAANSGLVRLAVVADLFMTAVWVFLALTLYRLLKHVHPGAARAMLVLVALGAGVVCLNLVFEFEAMRVATDNTYSAALGAAGSNALVLLLLDAHHYGVKFASLFMGLWLAPLGYLAYKSGMFPRALGVGLVYACACYLTNMFAAILAPSLGELIYGYVSIPIWILELWMVMYLLLIGVRTAKPQAGIPAAA